MYVRHCRQATVLGSKDTYHQHHLESLNEDPPNNSSNSSSSTSNSSSSNSSSNNSSSNSSNINNINSRKMDAVKKFDFSSISGTLGWCWY